MALAVGDRTTLARSVMSFIITDEITLIGTFSPNGFQTIKPGAAVKLVFDNDPGRIHHATVRCSRPVAALQFRQEALRALSA